MAAYRPGQGLTAGTADKLRERKVISELCEICGERTEESGLNCASVDDSKQWNGLLGEGTGNRKKARCCECTKPLPEDHDVASLGPFCSACAPPPGQWRPAEDATKIESTSQAEKNNTMLDEHVQFGHLVRPGICKLCAEERREHEREEAKAKRASRELAREHALEEGALEPPERVTVSLTDRPFGMTPSKAEGVGYLVAKVSEGKPAARAGIRPGWRVAEIMDTSSESLDLEAVQVLLKSAELPVAITFEALPSNGDFCTTCQRALVWALFSRKMRTKPADKRRCIACVEAAGVEGEAEDVETSTAAVAGNSGRGSGGRAGSSGAYGGRGRGTR